MMKTVSCEAVNNVISKRTFKGAMPFSPRKSNLSSRTSIINGGRSRLEARNIALRATEEGVDFDTILSDIADKFEKSDNKAAIIGYSFAAVFALWFTEWFIHLPILNFLLGGTVQLLGLVLLPYFGVKYFVDNDSITGDAGKAFDRVVKKLPGLDK